MDATSPGGHHLFIGTYTKSGSRGIYSVALDPETGLLGTPVLAAETPNPTFLAFSPGKEFLYAVCANRTWASSFRVDPVRAVLTPVQQDPAGSTPTPCHIAVDPTGRIAVAANYHQGKAAAMPLGPDGSIGEPWIVTHAGRGPHPTRQDAPHVHSTTVSPDGRFVIVCDLGLDRIYTYRLDLEAGLLPAEPPFVRTTPGAGPRHFAFGPDGRYGYAINELASTVVSYAYDAVTGALSALETASVLPKGYSGEATAAEIRVHPNGRFLYGSDRGPDVIASFEIGDGGALTPIEIIPCGGKGPRNFALAPSGKWLVCAHQDSGTLASFRVDTETGRLTPAGSTVPVPMAVCVAFLD